MTCCLYVATLVTCLLEKAKTKTEFEDTSRHLGQDQWKGDVGLTLTRPQGEDYTELGDVSMIDVDMIGTITQVGFVQVHVPKLRICQENLAQDTIQSLPKLHGLLRRYIEDFIAH